MRPSLPPDLFEPLAARIAEVSGIRVPVSKRWLLSARVGDRMRARGEDDVPGYVAHVLSADGAAELGRLVEAVRVGETQFYRHQGQLRAIRRVALPEIVARRERDGDRTVRVWSAGCASGEEAYTLAMMLLTALPAEQGWRHEVLATDMSEAALDQARRGRYPAASIHGVPPHVARWAFERQADEVVVAAAVRSLVRFEQRNLLSASYPRGFDLVLCRNVLIYFDRATQREVVERLARSVAPGGYLALGYAERLDASEVALHPIRTDDGVLYRRLEPGDPPPPAPPAPEPPAPRTPPQRTAQPGDGSPQRNFPDVARNGTVPESRGPARLVGELAGPEGEAHAHEVVSAVIRRAHPVLDLRGLRFADDGVARVLARAAAVTEAEGRPLVVVADAPGTLRFLRRHGIAPPATVRDAPPEREGEA